MRDVGETGAQVVNAAALPPVAITFPTQIPFSAECAELPDQTVYVGQVEELSTTGATTTTTTTYYASGKRVALAVNGSFYYLGSDGLGSARIAARQRDRGRAG